MSEKGLKQNPHEKQLIDLDIDCITINTNCIFQVGRSKRVRIMVILMENNLARARKSNMCNLLRAVFISRGERSFFKIIKYAVSDVYEEDVKIPPLERRRRLRSSAIVSVKPDPD